MNYLQKSNKLLKSCLKNKKSITLAFVVSFMISGELSYAEGVNVGNTIQASNEDVTVSQNGADQKAIEIDIKKAENGVSHNKFKDFSINKGESAILKNNSEKETSKLLELEHEKNKNFESKQDEASLIIAEVEKNYGNKSRLAGHLEILGKKADLIIANENGIEVNGQRFINTNSVSLTTGKYQGNLSKEDATNIDKLKESFDVNGGEVNIKGDIKLKDAKYFNVLANSIRVEAESRIGNKNGIGMDTNKDLQIGLYSDSKKSSEPTGIRAFGSMYANKITLKSFGENGSIHAGEFGDKIITAKEEIQIDSKSGAITLGGNINAKTIDITTTSHHNNAWDLNKDGEALLIEEESNISADTLAIKSKNVNDIRNNGTNVNLKDSFTLVLKDKIEDAENITKKIERRYQYPSPENQAEGTDLEELLDHERVKIKNRIHLNIGGEEYQISTKKEGTSIPWTELVPAEKKFDAFNNIEVSGETKTHLLKVKEHEKSTIVNIADVSKENGNKISHNKYKKFSMKEGENALLNNQVDGELSKSILLRKEKKNVVIAGNSSLSEAATLIINEVNNNNRETTELAGGLEVLGNKADVVIANENGIIINGGNFYNIGNLELSTGKYKGFSENRNSYEARKGDIILNRAASNRGTFFSDISNLKLYGKNLILNEGILFSGRLDAEIDEKIANEKRIEAADVRLAFKNLENQVHANISAGNTLNLLGDRINNLGKIEAQNSVSAKIKKEFLNKGEVSGKKSLSLEAEKIVNEKKITGNTVMIGNKNEIGNKSIENKEGGIFTGNNLEIHVKDLTNHGEINIKENLKLNLSGNLLNESLKEKKAIDDFAIKEAAESGLIKADKKLEIKAKNIKNTGKNAFGKIFTEDSLEIKAENLENTNSLIFSGKATDIEVSGNIKNTNHANIESNGKIGLRAKEILNEASTIKSVEEMKIFTDFLKNYSLFSSTLHEVENPEYWVRKIRIKESWIKSWFNGYSLTLRMNKKQMSVNIDDATIDSKDTLSIYGNSNGKEAKTVVENKDALLRSQKDMLINGEVRNLTSTATMKADDLLEGILVDLDWNTSSLVENRIFQSGNDGKGITLKEALKGKINWHYGAYYRLLRGTEIPEIDRILNLALGGDWKSKEAAPETTTGGEIRYYSKDKRATISSGGSIKINGKLTNSPAADFLEQSDGRKIYVEPKVPVEYELASIGAEADISNPEKVEIMEDINQDVKRAREFLSKENGMYRRAIANSKYEYVTSHFISPKEDMKGFEYLNSKLEEKQKSRKDMKVIGDDYYQHNMISNMFKSSGVLPENVSKEKVDGLLDNASKEGKRLDLRIGVPLTEEQKANLKEHIVWYVESRVDSSDTLIPVIYTSKSKLAEEATRAAEKKVEKELKSKELAETKNNENIIEKTEVKTEEKSKQESHTFKGLSRVEAEKNIEVKTDKDIVNADSDIYAKGSASFSSKNLVNKNTGDSSANIVAEEKLAIQAEEKVELDSSSLGANKEVNIEAKDVDIKASDVDAGKGKLNVKAENTVNIEDKKKDESSYEFVNTGGYTYNTLAEHTENKEKSTASNVKGGDISITAAEDLTIKGSKVKAEQNVDIDAKNVNIVHSTSENLDEIKVRKNGFESGKFDFHSDRQDKKEGETINRSSIEGNTFDIKAKEDIKIAGSDLKAKEKGALTAEEKVSIEDASKKSTQNFYEVAAKATSFSTESKSAESTKIEASNVAGGDTLEIKAKEVLVKGSNIEAKKGTVKGENKVNFEASAESHTEKSSSLKLGSFGGASAGGLGFGVEASFDTIKNEAKAELRNDYDNTEVKHKKAKLPALANAEVGVRANLTLSEKESKTWQNSQLNFGEEGLDIASKGAVDIGGTDIATDGDLNVKASEIKTTKQKNISKEKVDSIDIAVKQSGSVTSSVLDVANTVQEIAEDAESGEINEGLAAVKAVGAVTNVIFNDAIGVNSTQSVSFAYGNKTSSTEEDTRNKISVKKNLNFTSTEGDIELNNLDAEIGGKAKLDAEGKLKLKGGEKKVERQGYGFNVEGRVTQSAGVNAVFGANSQLGVGGTVGANYEDFKGVYHNRTNFTANEVETNSKDSTELEGAKIRADKKATINSGKDLIVKSQVDEYSGKTVKASLGLNVSAGAASNTLVTGRVSASASAGVINQDGKEIKAQSGISAGESVDVEVKNNLELEAANIGSDTKKGNLNVGKEIITKDVETTQQSGGGIYGGSGGLSGEIGFDIEVGDQKDKSQLNRSVLAFEKENISSEKIVSNGKEIKKEELENDLDKSKEVLRDSFKKGGTASGSFSVKDTKKIGEKVKNAFKGKTANTVSNTSNRNLADDSTNDAVRRELPAIPEGEGTNSRRSSVSEEMSNRELPAIPGEETANSRRNSTTSSESPYEDIDNLRRASVSSTGEEATSSRRNSESSGESIYEDIDNLRRPSVSSTGEEATSSRRNSESSGESIYEDIDNLRRPSVTETTVEKTPEVVKESPYEDIDSLRRASVSSVGEESSSESSDTSRQNSVNEEVKSEKRVVEDIYATVDKSKKTAKRELPAIPGEEVTTSRRNSESSGESIYEDIDSLRKPSVTETTVEKTPEVVKESPYEDIDSLRRASVSSAGEESSSESSDTSRRNSVSEEVKSEKRVVEDIYATVDKSKKTAKRELPAIPGEEVTTSRRNSESSGESIYEDIDSLRKPSVTETTVEKAPEVAKESPYEDIDNLRRPSVTESTVEKTAEVAKESPYEDIDNLRRASVTETTVEKTPEVAKESPYEDIDNLRRASVSSTVEESSSETPDASRRHSVSEEVKAEVGAEAPQTQAKPEEKVESTEATIFKNSTGTGIGNTSYIPEKLSTSEKNLLFKNAREKAKEKDSAKVAEKKLELLAENSKNIPKEHLLKSLKELAYGLSLEDATALRKKSQETGKKINRPDVIEGFEGKNITNMGKAFKNIEFDPEYVKIREDINRTIVDKLDSNKEFHDLMKTKLSGNEEGIKQLFGMVESAKREALKEVTGIDGKKAEVNINTKNGPLSMKQGYYHDNVVNMNKVPIISFLRTKKQNNKEILDTIVHELTHHDQAQIERNKDKNIPENMKTDSELLALNDTYYINSDLRRMSAYKNQPVEREAFLSGHKLGEQLSKLVDKGYTEKSSETGKIEKIDKIEHLPNVNKNLEAPKAEGTDLGNNALIYGLKHGREELISRANDADKDKKNAILADSYIGDLNLGYEFSNLSGLAAKLNQGKVTEADIEAIASFKDPGAESALASSSRSRINKANEEDNKKIITELLKNDTAVDALKTMDNLNQKGESLLAELKTNEYVDVDNPKTSSSFTEGQNKTIEEYNAVRDDLNKARVDFFSEKTKLIAKETLERGGQVYFALDGLVTNTPKYNKDKTTVDLDNLKKLFDPSYEHYDAVTSHELRYLYDNFRENPNLKFTIKDQVIENPLKKLEISK